MIYPSTELEKLAKEAKMLPQEFSWNTPIEFVKAKKYERDPTIPFFESPTLPIEDIMKMVYKKNYSFTILFSKVTNKLSRIKNIDDLKTSFKYGTEFIKKMLIR